MIDQEEKIDKLTEEGDLILLTEGLNHYVLIQGSRLFSYTLGPRELTIDKHRSGRIGSTISNKK